MRPRFASLIARPLIVGPLIAGFAVLPGLVAQAQSANTVPLTVVAQNAATQDTAAKKDAAAEKPVTEPTPLTERVATLVVLDKFTSTTKVFEVNPGAVITHGRLRIAVRSCEAAPPWERPESAAFLQVDEQTRQGQLQRVYSGWMFARAASLHPFDHPAYNVSLRSCKMSFPERGAETTVASEAPRAPAPSSAEGEGE